MILNNYNFLCYMYKTVAAKLRAIVKVKQNISELILSFNR